ncbi:MAG: S8 family peptidase [Limnohabitans sp.]|nr:S8 family peptidase [Limnohabitans sp.]
MKLLISFIFCLSISICYSQTNSSTKEDIIKYWHHKDYAQDKVLGISLDKWVKQNKIKPKTNKIIVAVLDTQMDINHEDLKPVVWKNIKEIPNNNKDDDKNGYIDDVNGWDFLGTKNGHYMVYKNYEYTRIVREQSTKFQNKKREEIKEGDLQDFDEYQRALKVQESKVKFYQNWRKSLVFDISVFNKSKDTLKYFFTKENYTIKQLDSMYKIYKINDKTYKQRRDSNDQDLGALISYMKANYELNQFKIEDIQGQKAQLDSVLERNINIDFLEREEIGDNPAKLEKGYGNNKVGAIIKGVQEINEHATEVASIIGANRSNKIGIDGFSDSIMIMPIHLSASGDEHDKDIAMAIRYAVDNGAKVINMSFGKEFSLHKDWIKEAFAYAEKHNVLLVHGAGNDGKNTDELPFYPNDYNYDNKVEVCGNFITVGSTNKNYGEKMVSSFSNYGKQNVDIFAPGEEIYVAFPNNKYDYNSGTSLACPMVSGAAALIWLYHPKLTVQQVKKIILESGISYDNEVIVPGTSDKKVKFSELSKSGKILNVYNAMEMAKEVSKGK